MDATRKTSRVAMDATSCKRSGIKVSVGIRVSYVGKENICPSVVCSSDLVGTSRSPLPEGFPRLPLQDITDILYPPNFPQHDVGEVADQCQPQCKRAKCGIEAHISCAMATCESGNSASEVVSSGSRQCLTRQATVATGHVQFRAAAELHMEEHKDEASLNLADEYGVSAQSADVMGSKVEAGIGLVDEHDSPAQVAVASSPLQSSGHRKDIPKKIHKLAPSCSLSGAVKGSILRSTQLATRPKSSILKLR